MEIQNIPSVSPQFLLRAAQSDKNILILGETGSGKDVAAVRIHELSPRAGRPFVAVNCAGLPESLFESEIFGFARGAFTGAFRDKPGLLEAAGGGTVFFDEIADLPFPLQAKLLRVIDKKETRRLGDTRTRTVGARFLFAANRDLRREAEAGRFRTDLYYRISVVRIRIPPLRERKAEIPGLVRAMLAVDAGEGGWVPEVSAGAMAALASHDYPGNIRELENVVGRAALAAGDGVILPDHIRFDSESDEGEREVGRDDGNGGNGHGAPLTPERLRRALEDNRWNRTRAAASVGKSRRQFYRLLDKYRLLDEAPKGNLS